MSLLLCSTFLLFAIVFRIIKHYYSCGDHGIRLAKRSAPLAEAILGAVFILSFVISIVLIVLNAMALFPLDNPLPQRASPIGSVIGFSGILIIVIAQLQMGDSWRIGVDKSERTEFISIGLYAKSRNPIYFGILLYWIGIVLNFAHPLMWACAVTCWLCIELIVRKIEEPYLTKLHGDVFAAYCARTKRYLPF